MGRRGRRETYRRPEPAATATAARDGVGEAIPAPAGHASIGDDGTCEVSNPPVVPGGPDGMAV
jgi:hypothetical protein